MIERLAPLAGRDDGDAEALDRRALADVLVEPLRPELPLDLRLLGQRDPAHDAGFVGHGVLAPR